MTSSTKQTTVKKLHSGEASGSGFSKNEAHQHELFAHYLAKEGLPFIHARMDRESTIQVGWPDFTIVYQGRALCIEFKHGKGKVKPEQTRWLETLNLTGTPAHVCRDIEDAISLTKAFKTGTEIRTAPIARITPADTNEKIFWFGGRRIVIRDNPTRGGIDILRDATAEDIATLPHKI